MKSWQSAMALLMSGALIAGCNQGATIATSPNKSQQTAATLTSTSELSEQIKKLRSDLFGLQFRVSALEAGDATVSTEEEGYDVAKTKFGPFTVSTRGATPYLDGFKVKLRIGNLTNADFNGAKLNIAWGPPFDEKNFNFEEWSKNQKKKGVDLTTRFRSGAFTDVEIVLTPAKAAEIKSFTVGIELNQLALRGH